MVFLRWQFFRSEPNSIKGCRIGSATLLAIQKKHFKTPSRWKTLVFHLPNLPCWELTYPLPILKMIFSSPQVGYVSVPWRVPYIAPPLNIHFVIRIVSISSIWAVHLILEVLSKMSTLEFWDSNSWAMGQGIYLGYGPSLDASGKWRLIGIPTKHVLILVFCVVYYLLVTTFRNWCCWKDFVESKDGVPGSWPMIKDLGKL